MKNRSKLKLFRGFKADPKCNKPQPAQATVTPLRPSQDHGGLPNHVTIDPESALGKAFAAAHAKLNGS